MTVSKRGALYVLARIGPTAKEALPTLRRVARDKDWGIRSSALSAVVAIGPETRDATLFIQALKDDHWMVRMQGIRGLGTFEKPAPHLIDALMGALRDSHEQVRELADETLQKIHPGCEGN